MGAARRRATLATPPTARRYACTRGPAGG
jgi:hypothetical protein